MLTRKKNYKNYLNKVQSELEMTSISKEKTKRLSNMLEKLELIIPVIGAFSSGKSTLINSFLGQNYLPVGITPETALATELRYSVSEHIEAVRSDDSIDKYAINNMEQVKEKANEYKYLKMFLNNEKLKEIAPLILVDMPGFDSPLDLHNKAIMTYLNRGVYYIVLTSIEDGTITRSMSRQLMDIQEYQRDFSFFLSKANLRAESEVQAVIQGIENQISDSFDLNKKVVPIGKKDGESLIKIMQTIDPEKLFGELVLPELKSHYFEIIESLNIYIFIKEK